jgi:hypothetical protein
MGQAVKEEKKSNLADIPQDLVKYPPFAISRSAKSHLIWQVLDNGGKLISTAAQPVTTEDAEKFFIALCLAEEFTKYNHEGIATAGTKINAKDIAKFCNLNDYQKVLDALSRIASMKIECFDENGETISVTHLIHAIKRINKWDYSILCDHNLFMECKKALTLNIALYVLLSPATKNIYSFLNANKRSDFLEDKVIERSNIVCAKKWKARQMLKKGLNELVTNGYLKSFTCENGKVVVARKSARTYDKNEEKTR